MNNRWRGRLNELLKEKNTLHNTTTTLREAPGKSSGEFSGNVQTPTPKTPKTQPEDRNFSGNPQAPTPKTPKTQPEADSLGLVATWSIEFGYISVRDPATGAWHDVATTDAADWAKREAFKRKELYRDGNRASGVRGSRKLSFRQ